MVSSLPSADWAAKSGPLKSPKRRSAIVCRLFFRGNHKEPADWEDLAAFWVPLLPIAFGTEVNGALGLRLLTLPLAEVVKRLELFLRDLQEGPFQLGIGG